MATIAQLALPAVAGLIALLSYGPQLLFKSIEPSPLGPRESFVFNACVTCVWICYARACFTDPGRVPSGWKPEDSNQLIHAPRQRWCRKCETFKPPRAHHCKTCRRYMSRFYLSSHLLMHRSQMHSEDGSPLSMDRQLRFIPYISTFLPLPLLRCCFNDISRILAIYSGIAGLGRTTFTKRMCPVAWLDGILLISSSSILVLLQRK